MTFYLDNSNLLLPYDETNPLSIEAYSQNLIGKTFNEVLLSSSSNVLVEEDKISYGEKHESKSRKGGLGELIEECFFHYKCNNDSKPDFNKAGVELKVTPYKYNKNKTISAKERLIITMIDYFNVVNEDFETSHVRNKSKLILLVYYLYSKDVERLNYQINFSKLFSPPKEDLEIIKNDFKIIINKIKDGKAHELSESDTMYLGAATKSSKSSNRRGQPFSNMPAKPRAFSFKASYMTYVLNKFIAKNITTYEHIIKNSNDLKEHTFEEIITNRINKYNGKTDFELCSLFDKPYNIQNKALWIELAYRMLGIKSNQAEEFIKANITVKALRIESKNKIVESSPLPNFKFKELVDEEWEESKLFNYLDQQKFLFVVYKKDGDNYILKGAQLWNIPYNDLNDTVRLGWQNIKNIISNGVNFTPKKDKNGKIIYSNNLPKKSENKIIHIRPHAPKSAYKFKDGTTVGNLSHADELPDGCYMTKQSFWLNNSYILTQLKPNLLK